ncbi:MAG: 2,3-bisphosphoglycerate-dependent phosphoglycerate mutase [Marivirga sp.]|jgi:2,3-bisphosphoglycerate-dependent phosphoglycerate mutase
MLKFDPMKKHIIFILLLVLTVACDTQKEPIVFFVRHAEKDSFTPKDPSLSIDGVMRSVDLQKWFEGKQIDSILSTNTKRTLETAVPLAKAQGKEIGIYEPMNFEAFAIAIKALKADTIVIIGHSNTILPQIEALGITKPQEAIGENEYNKLFQVNLSEKTAEVHLFGSDSK